MNRPDTTARIASRFASNGAIRTAYYDIGSSGATPFVLVHGFTGSKLDFHDQLPWFAKTRRALAPDQRGHGETSHARPYRFEQLVEDLRGFLDAVGVATCHLLGHSMGGMVAMRFALLHPQRLASLILMDTTAEPITIMPAQVRETMSKLVLEQGLLARLPLMKAMPRTPSVQRGIDYVGDDEHWRRIEEKMGQMDPHAFVDMSTTLASAPGVLGELGKIRCRTTVLVGVDDEPFVEPSARMAATIPNARLVRIDNAAHCPQYENADAWRAAVEAHLAA